MKTHIPLSKTKKGFLLYRHWNYLPLDLEDLEN